MKVVYTSWRSQIQATNDVYHCASATHEGDTFTMLGVDMDKTVRPEGVVVRASQVALTVLIGDTYAVYDCDDSCELHN